MKRLAALVLAIAAIGAFPLTVSAGCESWSLCDPSPPAQLTIRKSDLPRYPNPGGTFGHHP